MTTQFTFFDYNETKQPKITIGVVDLNSNLILIDYQSSQFEMFVELREFLRDYIKTCLFTNYYFEYEGRELNDFQEFKTIIQEHQYKNRQNFSESDEFSNSTSDINSTKNDMIFVNNNNAGITGASINQAAETKQRQNNANNMQEESNFGFDQSLNAKQYFIKLYMRPSKYTEKKVRQHLVRFKEIISGDNCILNYQLESLQDIAELTDQNLIRQHQNLKDIQNSQNQSEMRNTAFNSDHSYGEATYDSFLGSFYDYQQKEENHLLLNDDIVFLRYLWGNNSLGRAQQNSGNKRLLQNPLISLRRSQNPIALTHPYSQLREKLKVPKVQASNLIKNISQANILRLIQDKNQEIAQNQYQSRSQSKRQNYQKDEQKVKQIEKVIRKIQIEKRNDGNLTFSRDHFLYRLLIVIEDQEYLIKVTETGFYYKNQIEKSTQSSFTLPGLLCQISQRFKYSFEHHLKTLCKHDPYKALTKCGGISQKHQWFKTLSDFNEDKQRLQYQNEEIISNKEFESGVYGLDYRHGSIREWNDEYQQCKELPKDSQMQRIQRKRTIQKIYSDFVDWETAEKSFPTFTGVNCDMQGIQRLESLDFEGAYNLATCIVKFLSYRVVCQSIIPGILSFSYQDIILEYGSNNNCTTIETNKEFHELNLKICHKLGLKSARIEEISSGQFKDIAGSPEIKGIRGTDKRKYLIDLVRLNIRDSNFLDIHNNSACLVREKLIKIYNLHQVNPNISLKTLAKFGEYSEQSMKLNSNVLTTIPHQNEEDVAEVKKIGEFLLNQAIDSLIHESLIVPEGGPTDSETLTHIFHFHGINIRYLGLVMKRVREECQKSNIKCNHLEFILEKELLIRSLKHLIVKYQNDYGSSADFKSLIIHVLNCMLSSHLMIDLIDNGMIKMTRQYLNKQQDLQIMQFNNQKAESCCFDFDSDKNNYEENLQSNSFEEFDLLLADQASNNKQKSKKKSKSNKQSLIEANPLPANLIIQSNQQCSFSTDCDRSSEWSNKSTPNNSSSRKGSQFSYKLSDTFDTNNFSYNKIDQSLEESPSYFSISNEANLFQETKECDEILFNQINPTQIFKDLNEICKARYQYEFDSEQGFKSLNILQFTSNKFAILREIFKIFGVILEAKQYHLENIQNICLNDQPKYEWLPFQYTNILEFTTQTKQIVHQNTEVDNIMNQANKAFKENLYEVAFDFYAQCVSIYVQLQGPLQMEAFECLQRMSRIIYLQSDINMAIDLQIKAVQISTVLFGIDHSSTAYALSTLALYYQQIQEHEKSVQLLDQAIQIFTLVEGENHPDIAATYVSLGYLFQELDMLYEALDSFFEAIYRFKDLNGEENIQIASSYSAVAVTYFHLDELRTALDYQEKSHTCLTKLQQKAEGDAQKLKIYNTYIESSNQLISYYAGCCIQREKALRLNQQQMGTRQCKRALSKPTNQILPQNLNFLDLLEYNRFIQSTLEQRQ